MMLLVRIIPNLPKKWKEIYQRVYDGEVINADDDPHIKEDGTSGWARWECRPWYEAGGTVGKDAIEEIRKISSDVPTFIH